MAGRRPRRALRRQPRAAGQAARRRRAPARPSPPRRRLRARAPRAGLRQDRGVARRSRRGRARRSHVGWREDVRRARRSRAWVAEQDHDALLGALHPLEVSAGDAIFVPAGVAPRDRRGHPDRRAAGADRPLDPARVGRLRDRRRGAGDARARLGRALSQRRAQRPRRRGAARARGRTAPLAELLPAAAAPFFSAQRIAPGGGSRAAARRLRGRHRHRRRRHPRRPRRDPRRRRCSCPMLRGPSAPTATSWPSPVAPRGCRRRDRTPARHRRRHLGLQGRGRRRRRRRGGARPGADAVGAGAHGRRGRSRRAARRGRRAPRPRRSRARPRAAWPASASTSVAETGMLLDATGRVLHPPIAWHDARGDRRGAGAGARPAGLQRSAPACPPARCARWPSSSTSPSSGAARWLNVAEWIVHRLGGRQVSELSLSSRTGLLDLDRPRAVRRRPRLGRTCPATSSPKRSSPAPTPGAATAPPLPGTEGAVLTVAGHDHVVAGLGVGVIAPGDVLDSCGTAEAIVRVAPPLDAAARRRSVAGGVTVGWHVAEGRQALLAGLWSGLALREVLDDLGIGESGREELSAGALAIAPGDAPALELELHSLERSRVRLPAAAPGRRVARGDRCGRARGRGADRARRRRRRAALQARGHRRLGARRRRARRQAPPRRHRGAAGRRGRLPRRRAARPAWPLALYASADDLPAVSAIAKEPA